jgi:hypothetical protein
LNEFDFRMSNRVKLGVDDTMRLILELRRPPEASVLRADNDIPGVTLGIQAGRFSRLGRPDNQQLQP